MAETDDLILHLRSRVGGNGARTWMGSRHPELERAEVHPPASSAEIQEAEDQLGRALPAAVRRVYAEVANGGFGPGYGLWGLISGHQDDDSVVSRYALYTGAPEPGYENWLWPRSRIVVAHWGCAIVSCLDLAEEGTPVYRFDPAGFISRGDAADMGEDPSSSLEDFFTRESDSFVAWMRAWLEGTLEFER